MLLVEIREREECSEYVCVCAHAHTMTTIFEFSVCSNVVRKHLCCSSTPLFKFYKLELEYKKKRKRRRCVVMLSNARRFLTKYVWNNTGF